MDRLKHRRIRESHLQAVFNSWPTTEIGLVGVPKWLTDLKKPTRPSGRADGHFGYGFRCDAFWNKKGKAVVAELKFAAKYEPLALAG